MEKKYANGKKAKPHYIRVLFIFAVCISLLLMLKYSGISTTAKYALGIAAILVSGEIIIIEGRFVRIFFGTYMLATRKGINFIDWISGKRQDLWKGLADWGLVVGFGLSSYFLFRKSISKRMYFFGILSTVLMAYFMLPYECTSLQFVNLTQVTSRLDCSIAFTPQVRLLGVAFNILGGWLLNILANLILGALNTLIIDVIFITSLAGQNPNYLILGQQVPGVAPLIPGITLPLFAGVAALAVILVSHEFSHGVLSRIAKIRLKSVGLLLFGIIPIGAFVEPDEKQLSRLQKNEQIRIFSAGISANLILSIAFFALLFTLLTFVIPSFTKPEVIVFATHSNMSANVIPVGSAILKWNGQQISNLSDFKTAARNDTPYSIINVTTNASSYSLRANKTGKVGVSLIQESVFVHNDQLSAVVYSVYTFVSLAFLLSLLVGIINLLPFPGLDGWRIFALEKRHRKVVAVIAAIVLLAIYLNVLPWAVYYPLAGIPVAIIGLGLAAYLLRWIWRWAVPKPNKVR